MVELIPVNDKEYKDWPTFMLDILKQSAELLKQRHKVKGLEKLKWGDVNEVNMTHPLSAGIPMLNYLFDMPHLPLPGCVQCLRYSFENMGANARVVVAPGREGAGIMQMAGGQSGQPGSPHFEDQQLNWVKGVPTPFLGGQAQSRLMLSLSR